MKKWSLMFVFLLISAIANAQLERPKVLYIEIDYENFNTYSFADIDCPSFDSVFKETKVSKKLTDSVILKN